MREAPRPQKRACSNEITARWMFSLAIVVGSLGLAASLVAPIADAGVTPNLARSRCVLTLK
jgi:hypothetical protein